MKSLADDLPHRVFDDSAETIGDLMAATGYGEDHMYRIIRQQIESGAWEKVYRRINGKVTSAYRRKVTKRS